MWLLIKPLCCSVPPHTKHQKKKQSLFLPNPGVTWHEILKVKLRQDLCLETVLQGRSVRYVGMELVELSMELARKGTSPKSPSTSASWSASTLPGSHHDFFSPKENTEVPCGVDGFLGNIVGNLKKMGVKTMDSRKKHMVWNPLRQITNQTWRYELAFQFSSWALGSIWLSKTHDIKQSMSGSHKDEGNGNRYLASNMSWKSPPSWIIISQQ